MGLAPPPVSSFRVHVFADTRTLRLVSATEISKAKVGALGQAAVEPSKTTTVGISIRNGPVVNAVDVNGSATNGKRRSRTSTSKVNYKDDSSDDEPLVRLHTGPAKSSMSLSLC